ncbi:MAG: hypothetical protein LBS41_02960 [Streptococcaceae bacterium]|nr:hypothetical protein [Streptococcaceae bacterium]
MAKMGRPKTDNPKNKKVTVNFTKAEFEAFDRYVERHETSKTEVIRGLVKSLVDAT